MASRKTSTRNAHPRACRGFTFFEVLIVIGLLTIVGSLGLLVSMDSYRSSGFYADRNLLVAALQRARAEAINNICLGACTDVNDGKAHGVHIQSESYVIFQGTSYSAGDPVNAVFPAHTTLTESSLSDVVFSPLTATTSTTGDITLSDNAGHTSTITIGSEGQITWTR